MDLKKLADPFPASDVEWRVGRAGNSDSGVWATVLAYITNRAIMQRLDDVCGPANWKNEFRYEQGGAVLCGISILVPCWAPKGEREDQGLILSHVEWVTKWDGAENTDIEKVKGGLSGSMKRAAVQWGIGRYLYDLEEGRAKVGPHGKHYQGKNDKKNIPAFKWDPPSLPAWALPSTPAPPTRPPTSHAPIPVADLPIRPPVTSAASEAKSDEDKKWQKRTLGERTDDELRQIIEAVKDNGLLVELRDSCRRILARRHPDAQMDKVFAEEHAFQDTLPIPK